MRVPMVIALFRNDMMLSVLSWLSGFTAMCLAVYIVFMVRGSAARGPEAEARTDVSTAGAVFLFFFLAANIPAPWRVPFREVKTNPNFYCDPSCDRNNAVRSAFVAWLNTVFPTPYLMTGDWRTVMPFLWNPNRGRNLAYERVWIHASDGERFATDWVFPPGGYDPDRPVVILLTGLVPAEHWTVLGGFAADAVWHLTTRQGMTAVLLVPRGSMGTHVNKHMFHGARTSDLREAILLVDGVLRAKSSSERVVPASALFAAGFSMGAMILANYCGQYGVDTRLRGAINFSGGYDTVLQLEFQYSTKTWQTFLAYGVKSIFRSDRLVQEAVRRGVDMDKVLSRRVPSVVDFDHECVAKFNGYRGVEDYYKDVGLVFEQRWKNVAVPLLAVAACDDPITHCDTLHSELLSKGNDNLMFLITGQGGHCGWPLGMRPWERGFDFSNEAISVFIEAVLSA